MTIQDTYRVFLEKKAASEGDALHEAIPSNDSERTADQEHARNQEDHRAYLHSVFSNAEDVQNNQSAEIRKLFGNIPKGTTTSNPLIKVAFREIFFGTLPNGNFLKSASSVHLEVAFHAFFDELEKIAAFAPAKAMPDVSRGMLRVAPHPTTGSPALMGPGASGPGGMHAYRSPVSHANPVARPVTTNPQPQTGLGTGSVQW